jgi:FAD/FMN-containing dehydrogenase/Fe-S oxidoreductase
MEQTFFDLQQALKGELRTDSLHTLMYATDASAYREEPLAVAFPVDNRDIHTIIGFCSSANIPLIPRTAGTSLAGQVVGKGLIVDVSKYLTQIIEINPEERYAIVQPGVIRDELNRVVAKHELFFAPETSTSNRCMIAGMVGNNSCGANSLVYGSARDHIISLKAILHDNSEVEFGALTKAEFEQKLSLQNSEGELYRQIAEMLGNEKLQQEIHTQYPDPSLRRRNTGYALDMLLRSEVFGDPSRKFNFCDLIAGSEGTLCFITEIKVNLSPFPHKHKGLLCIHTNTVMDALNVNLIALKYAPQAVELMDNEILQLTRDNIEQSKNRFFVQGDPGAIVIVEFAEESEAILTEKCAKIEVEARSAGLGTHFPIITGTDMKKVWDLRKAGLGVLSNMPGDAKPVPVIEDTAVNPQVLPQYIEEFNLILKKLKLSCVYHAHISTGEIHLRPVLNLKDPADVELFHTIALETAKLVKRYHGTLSGEHGDGRLRGEFIPLMLGDTVYQAFKVLKKQWDPKGIFNPGKITDTPPMNAFLRYEPGKPTREIDTIFDFSTTGGLLRAIEKCNGSGDCRKTGLAGGAMCPSYQATLDEKNVTRARANILREFLTNSPKKNPFNHKEIYEVLDLCLSCKACKAECPSNVDITKFKAEFLQHYYDAHHVPLRSFIIGNFPYLNTLGSYIPHIFNFFAINLVTGYLLKISLGFASKRSIPTVYKTTLRRWCKKNLKPVEKPIKQVYLFVDEFTDINDTVIGIKAVKLLTALNYEVKIVDHAFSGRTWLSKGMVRKAQKIAEKNVTIFKDLITDETPLLGIEPSGILTFRDEYPELVPSFLVGDAKNIGRNSFLIDEFIATEFQKGNIDASLFSEEEKNILFHGHCYQKALSSTTPTITMMQIPKNYRVEEIKSGCCGMAGAFGFEKEHYETSMKVGEMVLLPTVRNADPSTLITATGTSCRHQIKDGAKKTAYHPVEILFDALREAR